MESDEVRSVLGLFSPVVDARENLTRDIPFLIARRSFFSPEENSISVVATISFASALARVARATDVLIGRIKWAYFSKSGARGSSDVLQSRSTRLETASHRRKSLRIALGADRYLKSGGGGGGGGGRTAASTALDLSKWTRSPV